MKIFTTFYQLLGVLLFMIIVLRLIFPALKILIQRLFAEQNPTEQPILIGSSLVATAYLLNAMIRPALTAAQLTPQDGLLKFGLFFTLSALVLSAALHLLARVATRLFYPNDSEFTSIVWAALLVVFAMVSATPFQSVLETLLPYPAIPGIH
jgi:hypothetical protein